MIKERWNIALPGGPAGQFYSIVSENGRVIAVGIPDKETAQLIVNLHAGAKRFNYEALRETLAAYSHNAWAGWMRYLFAQSQGNPDGSVTIPAECVERWRRQSSTFYAYLPEGEKESDRIEADRIAELLDTVPLEGKEND